MAESFGPYRLHERLGRGGVVEVFTPVLIAAGVVVVRRGHAAVGGRCSTTGTFLSALVVPGLLR